MVIAIVIVIVIAMMIGVLMVIVMGCLIERSAKPHCLLRPVYKTASQ